MLLIYNVEKRDKNSIKILNGKIKLGKCGFYSKSAMILSTKNCSCKEMLHHQLSVEST